MLKAVGNDGICSFAKGSSGYAQTVIGYCDRRGDIHTFSGIKKGHFAARPTGKGFGWDPVFIPRKKNKSPGILTYAELSEEKKNRISHRMKAFYKFKSSFFA